MRNIKSFDNFINEQLGIIPILMAKKLDDEEKEKSDYHYTYRDLSFTDEQISKLKKNGFEVIGKTIAYKTEDKYKIDMHAGFSHYELTIIDTKRKWFATRLEQELYGFDAMFYNYKKFIKEHLPNKNDPYGEEEWEE